MIRRCARGQAAAEFAVTSGVFLLLTFALIELALAVYTYNTLCAATHEGARYAIVHGPNRSPQAVSSDVKTVMLNYGAMLTSSNLSVNLTFPNDADQPSKQDAKVSASYNYQMSIPFMHPVALTLSSSSQMLVEQ